MTLDQTVKDEILKLARTELEKTRAQRHVDAIHAEMSEELDKISQQTLFQGTPHTLLTVILADQTRLTAAYVKKLQDPLYRACEILVTALHYAPNPYDTETVKDAHVQIEKGMQQRAESALTKLMKTYDRSSNYNRIFGTTPTDLQDYLEQINRSTKKQKRIRTSSTENHLDYTKAGGKRRIHFTGTEPDSTHLRRAFTHFKMGKIADLEDPRKRIRACKHAYQEQLKHSLGQYAHYKLAEIIMQYARNTFTKDSSGMPYQPLANPRTHQQWAAQLAQIAEQREYDVAGLHDNVETDPV